MSKPEALSTFLDSIRSRPEVLNIVETTTDVLVYVNKPVSEVSIQIPLTESVGKTIKLIPPMHG